MELLIFLKKFFCDYFLAEMPRDAIVFTQIRVCVASLRCRAIGCVSRGWVGLPTDFHWAENSEKPQDSEFSQQRLRELLESSLRSPEDNLPEAPPIPGIRYVMFGSLDFGTSDFFSSNRKLT